MATHTYLARLMVGTTNVSAFSSLTSVGEVMNFSGPDITITDVPTWHLASTDAAKTFTPGFSDGGTITATVSFLAADTSTIYGYYRTLKGWMILFNDSSNTSTGSHWRFNGYWNKMGHQVPEDDRITMDFGVKVNAKPTFATVTA